MSANRASDAAVRFARTIAVLAFLVSIVVLGGWVLGLPTLTSVVPGWPRMVPMTAVVFALASISLWLLARAPSESLTPEASAHRGVLGQRVSFILAALVLLIGVVRLCAYVFGWRVAGLERIGLASAWAGSAGAGPNLMSPATAIAFSLLGGALLSTRAEGLRAWQTLVLLVLLVGWLGLARFVFGGAALIPVSAMAVHTALMLFMLSVALLCVRPETGLVALLMSPGAGGTSARYLFPAALFVPLGAGSLTVYSGRAGWLGAEAGVSLFALSSVIVFTAIIWVNAAALERADEERRRSQRELSSTQERMRLVVESALDAVITIDGAGVITGWSAQAESMFGWNRAEVMGRSLAQTIVPPRHREAHERGLRRYLETGETRILNRRVEIPALHRDQREFPVEIAITPILDGTEVSFSAFVRDITERTRAEAAVRESQRLLQEIVDNSQTVVYVKDLDGRYLLINRRFEEIFGLRRDAVLGRTDHHLFPKAAADAFRDVDRRAVAAECALTEEEEVPQADGLHTYISVKAPLRDAAGRTQGVFGISTDITGRKADEARLRRQLGRLELLDAITRAIGERQDLRSIFQVVVRSLEEHLPIDFGCVCLYDAPTHVLSVTCVGVRSEPLALELSLPEQACIEIDENGLGRCVRGQLVYEPDIVGVPFPFPARLARGGLRAVVFAPLIVESRVFGALITARRAAASFGSGDCEFLRQLSGHVALAAHQAQLYASLQRAYEDLRLTQQSVMQHERLRAVGQMASGIAHDINNALSPATLYLQLVLEGERTLSGAAREQLTVTQRAIEDVTATVARMREFYRQHPPEIARTPIDLNSILQQVIDLTHARWSDIPQEHGVHIRVRRDFAMGLPKVPGAESEIRDALTNLILNAVDAMPEGGTLTLRSRMADARVVVEVCDTGIGMSEADRSRCLEPFYTTKGERGTGLGLAMVYGMIQRHGAELQIDSELGAGTTMRLIFPTVDTSGSPVSVADVRSLQPLRILVVDDDPLILRSLQDTLEQDGHFITAADGGRAGIDAFRAAQQRNEPFAAVITDLGMPNVDGRSVAAAIKSLAPEVPVILLTGWGYRLQMEHERPHGVDRVLSKPPRLHELRATLAELAGTRGHS